MLDQVLDLLRTADKKNISIVWQLIQSDEDLKKPLEKWYWKTLNGTQTYGYYLPTVEADFIRAFEFFIYKEDAETKQLSIVLDFETKWFLNNIK